MKEKLEQYENKTLIDEMSAVEEEMKTKTHVKRSGKFGVKPGNELSINPSTTIFQKKHSLSVQENDIDTPDTRDTVGSGKSKSEKIWAAKTNEGRLPKEN